MDRRTIKLIQQRSQHQSNASIRRTRYNAMQSDKPQEIQEVTNSLISKENSKKL